MCFMRVNNLCPPPSLLLYWVIFHILNGISSIVNAEESVFFIAHNE